LFQAIEVLENIGMEYRITDDIDKLRAILPVDVADELDRLGRYDELIEVVLDLGRRPTARYLDAAYELADTEVTAEELDYITSKIGYFDEDNRGGIERTLHRISAIRNRRGDIIGLTCRVGRAVYGTTNIIEDIIAEGRSVLLLGSPGVGKTTMLREAARMLGQSRRVVIVDTSNEIGGDGDVPHPAIGMSRRMQVPQPALQHEVMIEAVENHNPQVIIIDEIGRELEALAARTIAERGVQLIGTAHGITLENLIRNPTLSDLIGGIESVTLSDEEARRRGTQKSVLERRAPPTFDVLIEIQERQRLVIHNDLAASVDALLRGHPLTLELRRRDENDEIIIEPIVPKRFEERTESRGRASDRGSRRGRVSTPAVASRPAPAFVQQQSAPPTPTPPPPPSQAAPKKKQDDGVPVVSLDESNGAEKLKTLHVYPYGVARNRLVERAVELNVPLLIVDDMTTADILVTLKNQYRRRPKLIVDAERRNIPIHVLRANTSTQIENFLIDAFGLEVSDERSALEEVQRGIEMIRTGTPAVELSPQKSNVRRQQHQMAVAANLVSHSFGNEPNRHVILFRTEEDLHRFSISH
jgi:stage III sporulation protein SpoIIIAA